MLGFRKQPVRPGPPSGASAPITVRQMDDATRALALRVQDLLIHLRDHEPDAARRALPEIAEVNRRLVAVGMTPIYTPLEMHALLQRAEREAALARVGILPVEG